MSIARPDLTEIGSSQSRPLPNAGPLGSQRHMHRCLSTPDAQPGDPMLAGPSCLARTPEMSFTSLIAQLTRQLKTLEQTFMRALAALARSVEKGMTNAAEAGATQAAVKPNQANPYDGLIRRTAQRHQLDPALLTAVVRAESGFNAEALSPTGAMGLMQLMPATAKSLGVRDPYNPSQNVEGGATLLRNLIDRYDGRLDLALAAYNAGPGAVDRFSGVPPYAETRGYVDSVLADYRASALGA